MSTKIDDLAKHVRTLIVEIDDLGYIFNELSETYLKGYAEDESPSHPIRKLSASVESIKSSNDSIVKMLVSENILDPSFRRALQKLATIDALKDGNSAFVDYVTRNIRD
jgi:hypothetical protein